MVAALWVPDRRDVIYIQFNPQSGQELPDEHPMVVLSSRAFNDKTSLVIGIPMTHSARHRRNSLALAHKDSKGQESYLIPAQVKSLDWRSRGARPHPMGKLDKALFDEARDLLNEIVQLK